MTDPKFTTSEPQVAFLDSQISSILQATKLTIVRHATLVEELTLLYNNRTNSKERIEVEYVQNRLYNRYLDAETPYKSSLDGRSLACQHNFQDGKHIHSTYINKIQSASKNTRNSVARHERILQYVCCLLHDTYKLIEMITSFQNENENHACSNMTQCLLILNKHIRGNKYKSHS